MPTFAVTESAPRKSIRQLLETESVLYSPGIWDCMSALAAQNAGFTAVTTSGLAIAASMGLPDADLYSKSDVVDVVRRISQTIDVPVVADIDTGYGNAVNVIHTVRAFEDAGASAMFMEDQVSPKRCNYCSPVMDLTELDIQVGKIRAALAARRDPQTIIVARTDAEGDEINRRAEAYAEAGADLICPVATNEEMSRGIMEKLHERLGIGIMSVNLPGTWQDELTHEELEQMGVRIMMVMQPMYSSLTALKRDFELLRANDRATVTASQLDHDEYMEFIGWPQLNEMSAEFLPMR